MEQHYDQLANLLKAMAHPLRLQILDLLRGGELCVCHIEAFLNRRQAYISQQLMTLRAAGLVECRREGLLVYYRIAHPKIDQLLTLMSGTPAHHGHKVVDGCPCPTCATIAPDKIK
jgi:DNA-binding transcriptional ArsR family regulator